jgi:hypothetical protein
MTDITDKIKLKKVVKTTEVGSKLSFAIKNMMMINASGENGEFVLIVTITLSEL